MLARIFHQESAAASDLPMLTASYSLGDPQRTDQYASGPLARIPWHHRQLRRLATKPGEKCGLRRWAAWKLVLPLLCAWFLYVPAGCTRSGSQGGEVPVFDGDRAFSHLTCQVEIGYRVPGMPGHRLTMEYLRDALRQYADSAEVQQFHVTFEDTTICLWNIIGHFKGVGSGWVVLGAHWDTRLLADEDPEPANRSLPIAGANDGASGVAVLLELARLMGETPPPLDVDIVLFDAEDQGGIANLPWCMGSSVYARALEHPKPDYAIVVDMVGDRDLQIYVEANSERFAYSVVQKVWNTAKSLGVSQFIHETKHTMYDDHIPLIDAGVPSIVIIDFDYPYWHTLEDTPDKCSPRSLEAVGKVLTAVIYETST